MDRDQRSRQQKSRGGSFAYSGQKRSLGSRLGWKSRIRSVLAGMRQGSRPPIPCRHPDAVELPHSGRGPNRS